MVDQIGGEQLLQKRDVSLIPALLMTTSQFLVVFC
jgi:hypothetical protein